MLHFLRNKTLILSVCELLQRQNGGGLAGCDPLFRATDCFMKKILFFITEEKNMPSVTKKERTATRPESIFYCV